MRPVWNPHAFALGLETHTNPDMVAFIVDSLSNGADLMCAFSVSDTTQAVLGSGIELPNGAGITQFRAEVDDILLKYITAGTLVQVPAHLVQSCKLHPVDAHSKNGKVRLTHNLSACSRRGRSVNDFSPCDSFNIEYTTTSAGAATVALGYEAAIVFDISSAYRTVPVDPNQVWLQCFRIGEHVYASTAMLFGARSSNYTWRAVAAGILFILQRRLDTVFPSLCSCLVIGDDFFIALRLAAHLDRVIGICRDTISSLAWESPGPWCEPKLRAGAAVLWCGVLFDFEKGVVSIDADRANRYADRVAALIEPPNVTFDQAEARSLVGKLSYAACVTEWGRCRSRALAAAAHAPSKKGRAHISEQIRADLRAWQRMLARPQRRVRHQRDALFFLFSDASGAADGCGGAFVLGPGLDHSRRVRWTMSEYSPWVRGPLESSALLEAHAIAMAVLAFAKEMAYSTIIVVTDSTSAFESVRKFYSKVPHINHVLNFLTDVCLDFHLAIRMTHLPRRFLEPADALSHHDTALFKQLMTQARLQPEAYPTPAPAPIPPP